MKYSPTTQGFYTDETTEPTDLISVSDSDYQIALITPHDKITVVSGAITFLAPTSEEIAAAALAETLALADGPGFMSAIKAGLGGIVAVMAIPGAWALTAAIQMQEWSDVQALLIHALSTSAITQTQYNQIKSAATAYHIPITL